MAAARSHIALCLLLVLMTAHCTIALQGTQLPMHALQSAHHKSLPHQPVVLSSNLMEW